MKQTPLLIVLFIVMLGLQWYFPLRSILQNDLVLNKGHLHKLRLAPVDPRDVLRGEYIELAFKDNLVPTDSSGNMKRDLAPNTLITFQKDSLGFSVPKRILSEVPSKSDYLEVEVFPASKYSATVIYPFNKWYLQEGSGPEAEARYRKALETDSRVNTSAFALVKIYQGHAVLEDVIINGYSLRKKQPLHH